MRAEAAERSQYIIRAEAAERFTLCGLKLLKGIHCAD